jgi:hypothetical protein
MAYNQSQRCKLERKAVRLVRNLFGIKRRQPFKAPFDLVGNGQGIEVKGLSADSIDLKIHIAGSSLTRKLELADKKHLQPLLVAVIFYDSRVEMYQSRLTKSVRVNQMLKIN